MLGNKHHRLKKPKKTLISNNASQTKCFAFLKGPDNFLEEILVYDPPSPTPLRKTKSKKNLKNVGWKISLLDLNPQDYNPLNSHLFSFSFKRWTKQINWLIFLTNVSKLYKDVSDWLKCLRSNKLHGKWHFVEPFENKVKMLIRKMAYFFRS